MFKETSTRNTPPKNTRFNMSYYEIPQREDINECKKSNIDYRNKLDAHEIEQHNRKIEKGNLMCVKNNSSINHSDIILIYESNEYMKRLGRKDCFRKWKRIVMADKGFERNDICKNYMFSQDLPCFFERRSMLITQLSRRLYLLGDILMDIYKNLKKIHVCQDALRFFIELNFDVSIDKYHNSNYASEINDLYARVREKIMERFNKKNKDHSYISSSFPH